MTGELKRAAERAERFNEWFGKLDEHRPRIHPRGRRPGTTGKVWPEVLQLTLEGRGVREIAKRAGTTVNSVYVIRSRLRREGRLPPSGRKRTATC